MVLAARAIGEVRLALAALEEPAPACDRIAPARIVRGDGHAPAVDLDVTQTAPVDAASVVTELQIGSGEIAVVGGEQHQQFTP